MATQLTINNKTYNNGILQINKNRIGKNIKYKSSLIVTFGKSMKLDSIVSKINKDFEKLVFNRQLLAFEMSDFEINSHLLSFFPTLFKEHILIDINSLYRFDKTSIFNINVVSDYLMEIFNHNYRGDLAGVVFVFKLNNFEKQTNDDGYCVIKPYLNKYTFVYEYHIVKKLSEVHRQPPSIPL